MRLAVLSDTRVPTRPDGGHGLGISAHEIATGLCAEGHEVTLFAGRGSQFVGELEIGESELDIARSIDLDKFDAILDTGHGHWLSKLKPAAPVVNRLADLECRWSPPNIIVNSPFMQTRKGGKIINTGIMTSAGKWFNENQRAKIAIFMSGDAGHKGAEVARQVAARAGYTLEMVRELAGDRKWETLAMAGVLLHPSTIDAAPRLPLEAALVGTPTLCLSGDGARYHVADAVSGYVCRDGREMISHMTSENLTILEPVDGRDWCLKTHGYRAMVKAYEAALTKVANGECW